MRKRLLISGLILFWIFKAVLLLAGTPPEYGASETNLVSGHSLAVGDPVMSGSGAYSFTLPFFNLGGPMNLGFVFIYSKELYNAFWFEPAYFPKHDDNWNGDANFFWFYPRADIFYSGSPPVSIKLLNGDQITFDKDNQSNWVLYEDDTSWENPHGGVPIKYELK